MAFDVVYAEISAPVAQGGTISFPYPDGATASDYQPGGETMAIPTHQSVISAGESTFTVEFGAEDITVTYERTIVIPSGTRLILQINRAAPDVEVQWSDIDGKPSTFPPVIGTTSSTAKAGDYQPSWGDVTGKPTFADVAISGAYGDLTGTPTLGTAAAADIGDFATAAQGATADSAVQPGDLATVATSGAYSDLSGAPSLAFDTLSGTVADATGSDLQAILEDLASRVAALESA